MNIIDKYPPRVEFDFTKGSLQDQSANGYASTLTAGSAYWGKGRKGRSFVFDGAATALNLGNVSDFDNDEVQSFAAVFKTTSAAIQMIAIKSDGATVFPGWALYLSGGQIFFRIYQTSTGTGFRLSTDDTFNDGEYHSVVVTYGGLDGADKGGDNAKIYVDNQLVDTTLAHDVAFTASTLNTNDYRIGMASYGSLWFDGPMSYVAQFGVELSAQEATQLLTEMNTAIPYNLTDIKSYPASTGMKDGVVQAYIADGKGWNESVANVTSGLLENTGFTVNTGTWKVSDRDGFNKVLECVADGQIEQPLGGVSGWTTNTFELVSGTPTLIKNATNIQIDAVAGDKVGVISLSNS